MTSSLNRRASFKSGTVFPTSLETPAVLSIEYRRSLDRLLGRRAVIDGSGAAVPSFLDELPFDHLCVMLRFLTEL